MPIDSAAPKGRLILPQQQTIRDILEADAAAIVVKENELTNTLQNLGKTTQTGYHRQSGLLKKLLLKRRQIFF